jgi:hypothetical protein
MIEFLRRSISNFTAVIGFSAVLAFTLLTVTACDNATDADTHDNLHVKFINDQSSEYTIVGLELRAMGAVEDTSAVAGEWGDNILTGGKTIAPGGSVYFDLSIPNLHWDQYRVTVDDGNGGTYRIDNTYPPITHWGSDDRTVSVLIKYNAGTEDIRITGWGDNAGISK